MTEINPRYAEWVKSTSIAVIKKNLSANQISTLSANYGASRKLTKEKVDNLIAECRTNTVAKN